MTYFCPLASGSYGNSYLYVCGDTRVLVDAGTSAKYIAKALAQFSFTAANLTHILITHGHSDHISALPVLLKRTPACVVCSEDTLPFLPSGAKDAVLFSPGDTFVLHGLPVRTFSTPHDIPGSCGYVLGAGDEAVGICTDLGHMDQDIFHALCGVPTVVLESNHDVDMLKNGPYPRHLRQRILSPTGHLSNADCAKMTAALARRGARNILLAHLSQVNNTPDLAVNWNRQALAREGMDRAVRLSAIPRTTPGQPVILREDTCSLFV